jgi:4-oxalocrotonate tautomerase
MVMPYINVKITKGASRDQKKAIVEDCTESLVKHLGKSPEHIHIVIDEIEEENWGFSGMLTDDFRKAQHSGNSSSKSND